MKAKLILAAVCLFSMATWSQSKIGTINSELIIGLMPETKRAIDLVTSYGKRLDSSYQIKLKEYQDLVADYQKKEKEFTEALKKIKYNELAQKDQDLQQNRVNGSKLLQIKKDEVMRPVYKKLAGVIAEISKAEGFTQVLTTSGNEFAYIDEKFDITQKVMDKLGLKLPEAKN